MRRVAGALAALVLGACAPASVAAPSPTPITSPTTVPSVTKPTFTQAPLPPPTYVRWAIDTSNDPSRPYLLVLIYDGIATGFRIVDGTGKVILRVGIMGSGVFGPEMCAVKARAPGKLEGFTGISIDATALRQFTSNATMYKVEADSVGFTIVTVPLTDTGCRA